MFHVGLGLLILLPGYFCRASKDRGCLGLRISPWLCVAGQRGSQDDSHGLCQPDLCHLTMRSIVDVLILYNKCYVCNINRPCSCYLRLFSPWFRP